jgi:hypothetical protein
VRTAKIDPTVIPDGVKDELLDALGVPLGALGLPQGSSVGVGLAAGTGLPTMRSLASLALWSRAWWRRISTSAGHRGWLADSMGLTCCQQNPRSNRSRCHW